MGHKSGERVGSSYCHGLGGNQVFAYTKRHQVMSDDNCLDAANSRGPVNLVRCHGMMGNQEWKYDNDVSITAIYQCFLLGGGVDGWVDNEFYFRRIIQASSHY